MKASFCLISFLVSVIPDTISLHTEGAAVKLVERDAEMSFNPGTAHLR